MHWGPSSPNKKVAITNHLVVMLQNSHVYALNCNMQSLHQSLAFKAQSTGGWDKLVKSITTLEKDDPSLQPPSAHASTPRMSEYEHFCCSFVEIENVLKKLAQDSPPEDEPACTLEGRKKRWNSKPSEKVARILYISKPDEHDQPDLEDIFFDIKAKYAFEAQLGLQGSRITRLQLTFPTQMTVFIELFVADEHAAELQVQGMSHHKANRLFSSAVGSTFTDELKSFFSPSFHALFNKTGKGPMMGRFSNGEAYFQLDENKCHSVEVTCYRRTLQRAAIRTIERCPKR